MAAPAFGFSVGDFIAGARILVQVIDAFREVGGASSKYATQVSFLQSLKATLEHLERHVRNTAQSDLSEDISKLLNDIWGPWTEFKKFLEKHERSLGQIANKPRRSDLGKIPRVIQFTMHDISGKVEKLRREIQQPLAAVNSLLLLHIINSLENLPDQKLRPEQCAQLVEAIRLADIPAELDKQIRVLKRTADEHNIKQDEQLEIIKTLRNQLYDLTSTLQKALDGIRRNKSPDLQRDLRQDVGRLASVLTTRAENLEAAMRDQEQMIQELKSFVEDKSSNQRPDNAQGSQSSASWPSATVSAAYFAALLLSTVVSTCTATSVINRGPGGYAEMRARSAQNPVFFPKDYALPGLRISDYRPRPLTTSTDKTSAREAGLAAENQPPKTGQSTARQWVSDFSSQSRGSRQTPIEQGGKVEGHWSVGDSGGGSSGMSKLDTPGHSGDHHDGQQHGGGDPIFESGPVMPPEEDDDVQDEHDPGWGEADSGDASDNIWDESDASDSSSSDSGIGCSSSGFNSSLGFNSD